MRYNSIFFKKYGIKISPDVATLVEDSKILDDLDRLGVKTKANPGTHSVISELEMKVKQYPEIPQFKNYLYVSLMYAGRVKEAKKLLDETIAQHPDYFYAKLSLAEMYVSEKNYPKAASVLQQPFDVRNLIKNEYIADDELKRYNHLAIRVALYFNEREEVDRLHKMLFDYFGKTKIVKDIAFEIFAYRMANMVKEAPNHRQVTAITKTMNVTYLQAADGSPIFTHPEVKALYEYDDDLPKEVIEKIMALPRASLIKDLETVLADTHSRVDYYSENDDDNSHYYMPIHAIYLLAALEAHNSIDVILEFLKLDDEGLEFWFALEVGEYVFEPLYLLGKNRLSTLKRFLLEENINAYLKSTVSSVCAQVAIKYPERRAEVVALYREVFQTFIDNKDNPNLIDTDALSFINGDILEFRGVELKDKVIELFELGWINTSFNGTEKEVLESLEKPLDQYYDKPMPLNITEMYDRKYHSRRNKSNDIDLDLEEDIKKVISPTDPYDKYMVDTHHDFFMSAFSNNNADDDFESRRTAPQLPIKNTELKIGRNDPCHCGSGKKYKKCHGK